MQFRVVKPVALSIAAASIFTAGVAQATLVQTDFNQQDIGQLDTQTAFGTGLTGIWDSTSAVPDVFANDLSAPSSTGFNLTQGTTGQRVRLDNVERQNGANLTTSLTGTVWGTFLVNTNGGGTAGIGINNPINFSTLGERPRLLASGTDLVFNSGSFGESDTVATGVVPDTGDTLVLFRMIFDGSTGFTIEAWANPDLTTALSLPQLTATSTNALALSFNRLGVGGSQDTTSGDDSYIDFITLSDGPNAFQDVTGREFQGIVPEPASLALIGLGGLLMVRRRSC